MTWWIVIARKDCVANYAPHPVRCHTKVSNPERAPVVTRQIFPVHATPVYKADT